MEADLEARGPQGRGGRIQALPLAAWETPEGAMWLGGVVYKPGQYGEYIVPLIESLLAGENPDKMTTMDHAFLTIDEVEAVKEEMGVN